MNPTAPITPNWNAWLLNTGSPCVACPAPSTATETRHTAQEWTGVFDRMRGTGADLSDDEAKQVQAYLAKMYGKPG